MALLTDLERAGFHVNDTQVVLERDARSLESVPPSEIEVRLVRKGDEIGVEDVTR